MNKNDQKWPYVAYPTTWTCTVVLSTDLHFWHDSRLHTRRQCCNFGVLKYWNEERYTSREKKCHSCVEFLFFHFWKSGQKYIGFTGCNRWVSQMFQWTIVFGTIWDCTYDDNFATFEWMIRRNKKVRGSNVSWLLRKFFFQKKNLANIILEKTVFWQTTSEHHSPSCCILNVSIYKHFWQDLRLHTLQQCCNVWWDD